MRRFQKVEETREKPNVRWRQQTKSGQMTLTRRAVHHGEIRTVLTYVFALDARPQDSEWATRIAQKATDESFARTVELVLNKDITRIPIGLRCTAMVAFDPWAA